ncbi:molecular chaperone [Corynebacterium sp.]|uniref:TorD/DmsD family molecular chaperone n=1 Tax=Corynebacterium sp. TaxID=1720 RepID=UPI003736CB67
MDRLAIAADIVGQLYLSVPRPELRTALNDEQFLRDWPLADEHSAQAVQLLLEAEPDTEEELKRDHLYLFTGIGAPLAQPYESPYFAPDGLVMDTATAEVTEVYRQVGFSTGTATMPDDHIGFQLMCIGHMARGHASADDIAQFVEQHLGRFADKVMAGVDEHARTAIYRALPDLTRGVIAAAL